MQRSRLGAQAVPDDFLLVGPAREFFRESPDSKAAGPWCDTGLVNHINSGIGSIYYET